MQHSTSTKPATGGCAGLLPAAAASLLLTALPAHAGWQGISWGLPHTEVSQRLPEASPAGEDQNVGDYSARLAVEYPVGGIQTEAVLLFDAEDSFRQVHLAASEPSANCRAFVALAGQTYGAPERSSSNVVGHLSEWRDLENGNLVTLLWSDFDAQVAYCVMNYRDLPTKGAPGGL